MERFCVGVKQFRGTPYEIGREQAEHLTSINWERFSELTGEDFLMDDMVKDYQEHAPHLLAELKGLAGGLGKSLEEVSSRFSGHQIKGLPAMGCSSMVTEDFAVRNYDFSPIFYDHQLVLSQPRGYYASVGSSLHLIGRHEGVNEKGLFIALHFVSQAKTSVGLSGSAIVRIVLDMCSTTDEAVAKLKTLPHSWGYNYSVGDEKGHHVVVEASPEEVAVRKGEKQSSCTNHFVLESHQWFNRPHAFGSKNRHQAITEWEGTFEETFHWFSDQASVLFSTQYKEFFGTLHTFGYDFHNKLVKTVLPEGRALTVDWQKWIDGENLEMRKLVGSLDTGEPTK